METPWGHADHVRAIAGPDLQEVGTPSHGGYRVTFNFAEYWLTEPARRKATVTSNIQQLLWYEEDCDYAVLFWELPQLWSKAFTMVEWRPDSATRAKLLDVLSSYHPDYLLKVGVTPEPIAYARWQLGKETDRRRAERDPDLIVSAINAPGPYGRRAVLVTTADGKEHQVTPESYDRVHKARMGNPADALLLLSRCDLWPAPDPEAP